MRRSLVWRSSVGSLLAVTVDATTVVPLSFEQLVNESSSVVYGRVSDVRAQWTADRRFIESVVTVEILRGMKGSARRDRRLHGAGRPGRALPERDSGRAGALPPAISRCSS